MDFTTLSACRACGAVDLERVLDLGRHPLANSYVMEPVTQPTFPLELLVCRRCFLNQLSIVVDPDLMFREYLYVSGTSRTLREHFAALARQALEWTPNRPARVLDLACNDGTLLEAFRREGCSVCGVDPAHNLVAMARGKGLDVVEGYWPLARSKTSGLFDLITACNVLAHVADAGSFLAAALASLAPGGAVVLEFPYCRNMILGSEWDTIYHEHLSYFLAGPIRALADSLGASVTGAQLVPIHGGSLRLAIQSGGGRHCSEFLGLIATEAREGLTTMEAYRNFSHRVDSTCDELQRTVASESANGQRVIGYGASAKGNTLLNRCDLPLAYIVDDNPLKFGYLTPGRHVPIRPSDSLRDESADLSVLLLAWNFAPEIVGKVRSLRPGRRDRVIHYVPSVRAHDIGEPLNGLGN